MKLVWITGANGLIGNYLVQCAPKFATGFRIRTLTREQLDLSEFNAVDREFQKDRPAIIIHCAAITSVAGAQSNPGFARRVNVDITKHLAGLAADGQFIFFSTDLVFDGRKGNYFEIDPVNPINVYGETKAAAETIVLQNPRHTVVRTSLNAGISRAGNRSFNEDLRLSWRSGRGTGLFTDEFRCPMFAGETARAVWELAAGQHAGLFHVCGAEKLSRWQTGQLFAARWTNLQARVTAESLKNFAGPARAPDTSLDISKIQKILAAPLPAFSRWLAAHPDEPL